MLCWEKILTKMTTITWHLLPFVTVMMMTRTTISGWWLGWWLLTYLSLFVDEPGVCCGSNAPAVYVHLNVLCGCWPWLLTFRIELQMEQFITLWIGKVSCLIHRKTQNTRLPEENWLPDCLNHPLADWPPPAYAQAAWLTDQQVDSMTSSLADWFIYLLPHSLANSCL